MLCCLAWWCLCLGYGWLIWLDFGCCLLRCLFLVFCLWVYLRFRFAWVGFGCGTCVCGLFSLIFRFGFVYLVCFVCWFYVVCIWLSFCLYFVYSSCVFVIFVVCFRVCGLWFFVGFVFGSLCTSDFGFLVWIE